MLLAIDTATRVMSLALHTGTAVLAEHTWHTSDNHTTELAPTVRAILRQCEKTIADLTVVAVSTGPGSYSGLRVGVALAKGLAGARKLPLVGISTLDVLAAGQPNYQSGHGLIVVVAAGRGRIIVKTYRWRKGRWTSHAAPRLMDWEELFGNIDGQAHLTGEINEAGLAALANAQTKAVPVVLVPAANRLRRAGFLAEEAWLRLKDGKPEDFTAAKLAPEYIPTKDVP